ncbi:hypothetical protein [Arthrobacter sp. H14]|uniref:hypothetical protein n=1 Tax=Arthrobacter sp. H14 TaxID=1312959 RepID=UPI00047E9448|nr:hypothetical protein [Arthrobacter sp. H14]
MSEPINVPHGYRLPEGTSLPELAERLRTVMEPVAHTLAIRETAQFATRILDKANIEGAPRPSSVIFDAVQEYSGHVSKILSGDHTCPLTVMSVAVTDDPETGALLALVFVQYDEFSRALDDMRFGEYWPYWDESAGGPRPTGVAGADWDERGLAWRRALRESDATKPSGLFKIDIGSAQPDISLVNQSQAVFDALPSVESRVKVNMMPLLNGMMFASADEANAYVASNEHRTRLEELLKPITLEDIAGGAR